MIRRGTPLSRTLALAVVLGPAALLTGAFMVWAVGGWITTGRALSTEDYLRHAAEARATHAGFYGELGEAWRDYAATEISGLSQERSAFAAERAMLQRVEQLFARHEGMSLSGETLPRAQFNGADRLRAEARGRLPEGALAGFLEALETQPPFLFVDLLELRPAEGVAPRNDGLAQLDVRLRVSTFRIEEADQ